MDDIKKIDYNYESENIVQWIRDTVHNAEFTRVAIGISGGIDSAVVASLCVDALGKDYVFGVIMPCESVVNAESDAMILINNLGIRYHRADLGRTYYDYIRDMGFGNMQFDENNRNILLGNIKARLRMTTLYAFAHTHNAMVVGTGNKSEHMIGYFTKWGDGATDFEPIIDYYKTEVYQLADVYSDVIPASIISKPPSADLWSGQTDEDEIGMTYAELDFILSNVYDIDNKMDHMNMEINSDRNKKLCNKVIDMVIKNRHKNESVKGYKR